MSLALVAAVLSVAQAPLLLRFECEPALVDAGLVRAMVEAQQHPPAVEVQVLCLSADRVRVSSGALVREVQRGPGQQEWSRVVSLLVVEVARGRAGQGEASGASDGGTRPAAPQTLGARAASAPDAGAGPPLGRRGSADDAGAGLTPLGRLSSAEEAGAGLTPVGRRGSAEDAGAGLPPLGRTGAVPSGVASVDAGSSADAVAALALPPSPVDAAGAVLSDAGRGGADRPGAPADAPRLPHTGLAVGADGGLVDGARTPDAGEPTLMPIEFALAPRVGFNLLVPGGRARNFVALGVLGVWSTQVDGFALAPVSIIDEGLRGVQAAPVAIAGDVRGVQVGLVARTREAVSGVQLGGVLVAGEVRGAQVGLLNIAGDVTGLQLGVVNIAHSVKGSQVGLLNVADDTPAPIGVFNAIADTPVRASLNVSDLSLASVTLKSGGRHLYLLLSVGWWPRAGARTGGGLGTRFTVSKRFFLNLEWLVHAAWSLDDPQRPVSVTTSLSCNLGFRFGGPVSVLVGPQLSGLFHAVGVSPSSLSPFAVPIAPSVAFAPGVQIGFEL